MRSKWEVKLTFEVFQDEGGVSKTGRDVRKQYDIFDMRNLLLTTEL